MSYVGSQAHHLLVVYSANPGNPALCLSLPGCGPNGENKTYTTASGQTIQGTREGLGPDFSNDDYDASIGNSNFNSLQTSLRHSSGRLSVSIGYTYSKSIDQASSISDPINPFNFSATRALSAFDLKHNFVASYQYQIPFEKLTARAKGLTQGWSISGITRVTSGFPITLHVDGDYSLMGSIPNGDNKHSLDLPDYNGLPLSLNPNPGNGQSYFNTECFQRECAGYAGQRVAPWFLRPGIVQHRILRCCGISGFPKPELPQFRLEAFNVFNHPQFFGPATVNGDVSDTALFGRVVSADPPRLVQIALKYTF